MLKSIIVKPIELPIGNQLDIQHERVKEIYEISVRIHLPLTVNAPVRQEKSKTAPRL